MSKRVFDIIFKTKGLGKATSGLKGLGRGLGGLVKGTALAGAGVGILAAKLAGDFSKSLREVGTLMGGLTDRQMKDMSRELRHLSQTSGLALSSLSKAKYDVVSAGFANAADSAKILSATTRLAVGGVTSAANAADILTTALNAYGLKAEEVNDVSDILFTTVKLGKTTMDELGASLGSVLPIARGAGLELSTVGAAMASLTAAGISTAESSTALRGAIIALTAPADGARKAMEQAKLEAKRFSDGSLDLLNTIKQFEGMDPATLRKFIPDIRASAAIQSLAQNLDGLEKNLGNFEKRAGSTQVAFDDMFGEFNNQMLSLKNSSQSIMIAIGDQIIDAILPSITEANKALASMGEIGFEEVAKRLMDNFAHVKVIVKDSVDILGQELSILGSKISNKLPWWLGGIDDETLELNIAVSEQIIRSRMRTIAVEMEALKDKVMEPLPPPEPTAPTLDDVEPPDLTIRPAVIESVEQFGLKLEEVTVKNDALTKSKKAETKAQIESRIALQETAKAAALNATSAEDAAERIVRAAFMEALARQISKIMASVPFPFNLAAAAGAGAFMTGLFDQGMAQVKKIKLAQHGMDEVVSKPTLIMAGEAGPERVQVTPRGRSSSSQGGLTVNFNGPVTNKDFVRDTVIPEIQRVQKLGLA